MTASHRDQAAAIPCNTCKKESGDFINELKIRKKAKVDLENSEDWINGAFIASAGAGNKKGDKLRIDDRARQKIEIIFVGYFDSLKTEMFPGQSRFEWLLGEMVDQLEKTVATYSPATTFTFGRAQKIINIITKYCYAWWLCKESPSPKFGDISWIEKWRSYLHVPVDRETMKYLDSKSTYSDLVREDGQIVSWKWAMSKYRYLGIQDAIRTLSTAQNLDPICYEMKNIWPTIPSDIES